MRLDEVLLHVGHFAEDFHFPGPGRSSLLLALILIGGGSVAGPGLSLEACAEGGDPVQGLHGIGRGLGHFVEPGEWNVKSTAFSTYLLHLE